MEKVYKVWSKERKWLVKYEKIIKEMSEEIAY